MEADGAVDAQNAPTVPWKTLCVFHELPQGLSNQIIHEKYRKAPKWRWETRIDPILWQTRGKSTSTKLKVWRRYDRGPAKHVHQSPEQTHCNRLHLTAPLERQSAAGILRTPHTVELYCDTLNYLDTLTRLLDLFWLKVINAIDSPDCTRFPAPGGPE